MAVPSIVNDEPVIELVSVRDLAIRHVPFDKDIHSAAADHSFFACFFSRQR